MKVYVILNCPRQAWVVLGGWRAGWHDLSAPVAVKSNPKTVFSLSGEMGLEVEKEFPYLFFPFKVDQFKSKIKMRNYQVKKNTAKMLLYLHTMIFLKTRYIFTETNHISEIVSHVYFYILSSSSSL